MGSPETLVRFPHLQGDPLLGKILFVDKLHSICLSLVDPPLRDPEVEMPIEPDDHSAKGVFQRIGNDRDLTPIPIVRPSNIGQERGVEDWILVGNGGLHQSLPGLDPLLEPHELRAELLGGLQIRFDGLQIQLAGGQSLIRQFEFHSRFELEGCAKRVQGQRVPLLGISNAFVDPPDEGPQLVYIAEGGCGGPRFHTPFSPLQGLLEILPEALEEFPNITGQQSPVIKLLDLQGHFGGRLIHRRLARPHTSGGRLPEGTDLPEGVDRLDHADQGPAEDTVDIEVSRLRLGDDGARRADQLRLGRRTREQVGLELRPPCGISL